MPRLNVFDPTRTQNHFPLPAPQPGASPKGVPLVASPMLDLLTNRTGFRYQSTQNHRQTGKINNADGNRRGQDLHVGVVSTLATLKKLQNAVKQDSKQGIIHGSRVVFQEK